MSILKVMFLFRPKMHVFMWIKVCWSVKNLLEVLLKPFKTLKNLLNSEYYIVLYKSRMNMLNFRKKFNQCFQKRKHEFLEPGKLQKCFFTDFLLFSHFVYWCHLQQTVNPLRANVYLFRFLFVYWCHFVYWCNWQQTVNPLRANVYQFRFLKPRFST